uniref:hypothetical protein n=1 Tax=Cupriavidus necator TaxID=106590 RepID=UPI003F490DF0
MHTDNTIEMAIELPGGPFEVTVDDLSNLSAADAIEVFHQLLLDESARTDRLVAGINVPRAITTADGGVDAEANIAHGDFIPGGLLREGPVRYQVKTGRFSASNQTELKALVLKPEFSGKRKLLPEHLNTRLKTCLDAGGTFVTVLFGSDAVGTSDGYGTDELRALLKKIDTRYGDAKVEIIRANQISAAISSTSPGIALRLKGLAGVHGAPLNTLQFLADSCGLQIEKYVDTHEIAELAQAITDEADALLGFKHVRVLGDAGAGKTHLVFRGITQSASKAHALYCAYADGLVDSPAFNQLVHLSKNVRVILIADECDVETAAMLQMRLRAASNCLLITIFNERSGDSALGQSTRLIEVPALVGSAMEEIFGTYGIPEEKRPWLAELCQGSPRAAHKIGEYIQAQPELDYAEHFPKLDALWELVVCSPDRKTSAAGINRLTIARCVALFRRIAWRGEDSVDGRRQLSSLIQMVDSTMSHAAVMAGIEFLQARRILQGNTTLYISPKLLHVKLWCDWWECFAHLINDDWVQKAFTGRMHSWFLEMFVYANESKAATRVVERLLGPEGPLQRLEAFSEPGNSRLFFALAQANSKAALRRLKDALERTDISQRTRFREGRREVVDGLEHLAVASSTFLDAAQCLLLLAEAENEHWSNNATGVFVSLFTLGYAELAASELSPTEKVPYLRDLLHSDNGEHRKLVIRAIASSLEPFQSRTDIGDVAGLRPLPKRWSPRTYGELWDCYSAYVDLLAEAVESLPSAEREQAARGVIGNARSLLLIVPLAPRIVSLLSLFASIETLRPDVIEAIIQALHYEKEGLLPETATALEALRVQLTEGSFRDKLERYVGLQLVEDSFDEAGVYRSGAHPKLESLRNEALDAPRLLVAELYWLVTEKAKNGSQFGSLLGAADRELALWPWISQAWGEAESNRSDAFVGGYLSGVFERDPGKWEMAVNELFTKGEPSKNVLGLIWRSGMTETIAWQLLKKCDAGEFEAREFRWFVFGGAIRHLPFEILERVLCRLLTSENPVDANAALDILQSRRRTTEGDPPAVIDLLDNTLSHSTFLRGSTEDSADTMRDYHWTEGAKSLLEHSPQRAMQLATKAISSFGAKGSITAGFRSSALQFFDLMLMREPENMWNVISRQLQGKTSHLTYRFLTWLRGNRSDGRSEGKSGFELLHPSLVVEWIEQHPKSRAAVIAQYCPPVISISGEEPSLARLILESFGGQEAVRNAMHANFFTGTFWGPASDHYKGKLDNTSALLSTETDPNVRRWLQEEVSRLQATIETEIERERESRE